MLLVALFEYFPEDTQGTLKKRLTRNDSRVCQLRKASHTPTS